MEPPRLVTTGRRAPATLRNTRIGERRLASSLVRIAAVS